MIIGKSLHRFDLQLCDYVAGNVRQHFDETEFADWVRTSVPEALAKYLDAGLTESESPEMLLGDTELVALETAMENPPLELDREWLPYDSLHQRYVSTLVEIRKQLCPQAAEGWAAACADFSRRLSEPRLPLHDGIIIVQEWLWQLRRLLLVMEAFDLVCFPQGNLSTPLHSSLRCSANQSDVVNGLPKKYLDNIEKLRSLFQEDPEYRKSKPEVVIKAVSIGNQPGRKALRWLSVRGEYVGHTREQPQRFIEGRKNER